MSSLILEEISKLTKSEKLELARYILEEISKEEEDFELTPQQKAELDQYWEEIENGTAELQSGEQISDELNKRYGIHISLP